MWSYTTVEQLREALQIDTANELKSERLLSIVEGVSQEIDRHTGRSFRIYNGTQRFTPEFRDLLLLPDLLSITSVKLDWDGDSAHDFEVTLSATDDYHLEPINAAIEERPYTRMKMRPYSYYRLPIRPAAVEIVGKWGYWERVRTTGVTLSVALTDSATSVSVSNPEAIYIGWTVLIGSEQMYVVGRNIDNTLVVERGANGSTAAAHASGVALSRYMYPEGVSTAALMQAARIFRRQETPLGIVNNPGDIGWRAVYIPKIDLDVQRLLRNYTKRNVL